jgi:hypothetical protein
MTTHADIAAARRRRLSGTVRLKQFAGVIARNFQDRPADGEHPRYRIHAGHDARPRTAIQPIDQPDPTARGRVPIATGQGVGRPFLSRFWIPAGSIARRKNGSESIESPVRRTTSDDVAREVCTDFDPSLPFLSRRKNAMRKADPRLAPRSGGTTGILGYRTKLSLLNCLVSDQSDRTA